MNHQGHIGAWHSRAGMRLRRPSLQNDAMATVAARKMPQSHQSQHKVTRRQGSLRRQKPSKSALNRLQQSSGNVSTLSWLLRTSTAATAATTATAAPFTLSPSPKEAISVSPLARLPLQSTKHLVENVKINLKPIEYELKGSNQENRHSSRKIAAAANISFSSSSSTFNDKENCLELPLQTEEFKYHNILEKTALGNGVESEKKSTFQKKSKAVDEVNNKVDEICQRATYTHLRYKFANRALRDSTAAQMINLNRGIIRTQNAMYRATVLSTKKPPVIGFKVKNITYLAKSTHTTAINSQKHEQNSNNMVISCKNKENLKENVQNSNNHDLVSPSPTGSRQNPAALPPTLDIFAPFFATGSTTTSFTPTMGHISPRRASLPPRKFPLHNPLINNTAAEKQLEKIKNKILTGTAAATRPGSVTSSTEYLEAKKEGEEKAIFWNEFAKAIDCPVVDVVQKMDSSWFGTAASPSTATATGTSATSTGIFSTTKISSISTRFTTTLLSSLGCCSSQQRSFSFEQYSSDSESDYEWDNLASWDMPTLMESTTCDAIINMMPIPCVIPCRTISTINGNTHIIPLPPTIPARSSTIPARTTSTRINIYNGTQTGSTFTTTTTVTTDAKKKKGGFMSRCASKLGSWMKKVTPKDLEFLNDALL